MNRAAIVRRLKSLERRDRNPKVVILESGEVPEYEDPDTVYIIDNIPNSEAGHDFFSNRKADRITREP